MPLEGSEQQRYKTEVELRYEQRSIEREINKIIKEREKIQDEYAQVDKELLDNLKKQGISIEDIAKKRLSYQLRLEKVEKNIKTEANEDTLNRLKGKYNLHRFRIKELGVEQEIAKISSEALLDQVREQKSILDLEQQRLGKVQAFLGKYADVFNLQNKYYTVLKNTVPELGKVIIGYASLLALLESTFKVFNTVDESLAKFRIEMGFLRGDVGRIKNDILDVATEFTRLGVTVDSARLAVSALGGELGGVRVISKDLIETASLFKSQLGVSEDITAGFLRNISALTKSTAQAQRNMTYFAQAASAAQGVHLNLVMQDVAKMSGNALALVSRIPMQMIKSATEARRLGTTINKMAEGSSQILNFTESVQAEMEASVLLGKSINLQAARELAYKRDILGSTKAILAEARRIDFENLDFFQMNAFAAATGRSTEELLKMIQAQRQLREARGIESLKEEVALIDRMESLRENDIKNTARQTELAIKQQANQARLTALQNQWNQLLMETVRVLYPIFDGLLKIAIIAVKIGPAVAGIVGGVTLLAGAFERVYQRIFVAAETGKGFFSSISKGIIWVIGNLVELGYKIGNFFARIGGSILKHIPVFKTIGTSIGSIFVWVGEKILNIGKWIGQAVGKITGLSKIFGALSKFSFFSNFLKVLPGVGQVIAAFQFLYNLGKRFGDVIEAYKSGGLWEGIKAGAVAVLGALYDTIIRPFVDAYNWIKEWLMGKSPSKIGLGILEGIASIGGSLFNLLISPFKLAFNAIGSLTSNVFGWISSFIRETFSNINIGEILSRSFSKLTSILMYPWEVMSSAVSSIINKIPTLLSIISKGFASLSSFIFESLTSPWKGIYNILLKPFVSSFDWIMKWFGGKSPSEIGLSVVKGIVGVQSMIFDALTYPWRRFLAWIADKIPGMGGIAEKLRGGMSGALNDLNLLEKRASVVPVAAKVEPASTVSVPISKLSTEPTVEQKEQSESDSVTLVEILKSLQNLNANLLSGKIGIYIDGQLMSATLSRQTAFRGGYGVNNV